MLINYTFSNCYSFKDQTTLSLETGERLRKFPDNKMNIVIKNSRNKIDLLKNIVIFGSNGSGKSNLLQSLNLMQHIILNIPPKITSKIPDRKFLMDDKSISKPTFFEVEFIQNNTQYKYSFSYMKSKILNEKLEIFSKNKYDVYFERTENNIFLKTPSNLTESVQETRENVLFLQKGQDKNDYACKDVITWFEETLVFFSEINSSKLFYLLEDDENKKRFLKFLSFADMNIVDVEIEESISEMPKKVQEAFKNFIAQLTDEVDVIESSFEQENTKKLFTMYKKYDSEENVIKKQKIPLDQESSGTQKIIFIALNILFCKNNNKILILDEFDDAFHQELAEALIKIFNSKGNENQFIVTSHELNLMDNDLRKDQIYFTEKKFNGESELFSLFDFNEFRTDTQYHKRYIKGLFGAMPNIEADEMLNMFS